MIIVEALTRSKGNAEGPSGKRESRKKFCRDLENTSYALRVHKVLSKDLDVPKFLMNLDGSCTESSKQHSFQVVKTSPIKNRNQRISQHAQ